MENVDQRCGACKFFSPLRRHKLKKMGKCKAPVAESLMDHEKAYMYAEEGDACPVWETA